MLQELIKYFDNKQIQYSVNKQNTNITFQAKMNNANYHCELEFEKDSSILLFYSSIDALVPDGKRHSMAELICRINFGLWIGNIEMNFDIGEIKCKTSLDTEQIVINEKVLDNLIAANLSIIDDYYFIIIKGIISELSPEEILRTTPSFYEQTEEQS